MKKLLAAALLWLLPTLAIAQTCPPFTTGAVLTAGQWQACFNAKQNVLGYTPVNKAGDTMLGRLVTQAPGATTAGFNLTPGSTPSNPNNGDLWTTSAGIFVRINGATVGPLSGGTGAFSNPTAMVGLTAVNGVATTALRSDAAPALDQGINPAWSGTHLFSNSPTVGTLADGITVASNSITRTLATGNLLVAAGSSSGQVVLRASGVNGISLSGTAMTQSVRQYYTMTPVYDLVAATLGVGMMFTLNSATQTVAALKEWSYVRLTQGDGSPIVWTVGSGAFAIGFNSQQTLAFGSDSSANLYGAVLHGINAGPGSTRGVHVLGTALTGSIGNVNGGAFGIIPVSTSGTASAIQVALESTGVSDVANGILFTAQYGDRWKYGIGTVAGALKYNLAFLHAWMDTGSSGTNARFIQLWNTAGVETFYVTKNGTIFTGLAGTQVGSIGFANASTGSITVQPTTGALGSAVLTLPAVTGTFVTTGDTGTVTNTMLAGSIALTKLATQATNTVVGNATSGSAAPTALAVGSCSTAGSALIWTTNTGFGCNTSITASSVAVGSITGAGTGVLAALAINVGSAGAFVTFNGALGTPSSGTVTNFTGTASININGTVGATTPNTGAFTSVAYSTTLTGTSTNANALAIGRQGATNPVLQIDASTATVATGIKIKGAAAAAGVAVSVITSGTNENLNIDAAGSGTITFGGTSTGAIVLTRAATLSAALTYGGVTLSNAVTGTGNMVLATSPTIDTPTITTSAVVPLIIGGSAVSATLILESTSGVGSSDAIIFKTGSQLETARFNTNGRLIVTTGLGSTTPGNAQVTISKNVTAAPNFLGGAAQLQLLGPDGSDGGFGVFTYGGIPTVLFSRANGTNASKTVLTAGTTSAAFTFAGYDGSAVAATGALFVAVPDETWSASAHGMYVAFYTTPKTTTATAEAIRIAASGGLSVGTTTDPGIGAILANTSIKATTTLTVAGMANAATTSAVCITVASGLTSYNSTVGTCTVSILAAKNLIARLTPREGYETVMSMEPWLYEMKKGRPTYTPGEQVGFVADWVKDKRLVAYNPDGTVGGFRYEQYTADLTAAFHYNDARIARIEIANDNLRAANDNLRQEIAELKRRVHR